jgi:hypothetical protein
VEIPADRIAEFREELVALVAKYEATGVPGAKFTVLAAMHPRTV